MQVLLGHQDPGTTARYYARYDIASIERVSKRMRLNSTRKKSKRR